MNNQPAKTHPQPQKIKNLPQLSLEQLDGVAGGSVYKVSDVTLKRGIVG